MPWDFRTAEEIAFDKRLAEFCAEIPRWDQWVKNEGPPAEPTDRLLHPGLGPVTVRCVTPLCMGSKITPVYPIEVGTCEGCGRSHPLESCIQIINIDNL